MSRRSVVVGLAMAACLPLAAAAIWLLPWPYWPFVLLTLGLLVWTASLLSLLVQEEQERTHSHGLVDGFARLRGTTGVAMTDLTPSGAVKVAGEVWAARSAGGDSVRRGSPVTIVGAHDLELLVQAVAEGSTRRRHGSGDAGEDAHRLGEDAPMST